MIKNGQKMIKNGQKWSKNDQKMIKIVKNSQKIEFIIS